MPPSKGSGSEPLAAESRYAAHAAAHDVNNLLHVIIGCCERLRADAAPHQLEELEHIAVAAEHAAALASRVLGSGASTEVGRIDLPAALRRLEGLLRRIAGEHVSLRLIVPPAGTPARMHPGDLAQVLVNLTVNARDAMPHGGHLVVDVSVVPSSESEGGPAGMLRLRVADTGLGMTPEVRERVFERFFTTKAGEGTGHGLATVQSIVQQYGGTIDLRSEPGRGAEFVILLPIVEPHTSDQPVTPPLRAGAGEMVLIVDDEPMARDIVVSFLQASGYTAIEAGSARDALDIVVAGTRPIDLVVADVTMPDATGIDLARWVADAAPSVPVLLVSGDPEDSVAAEAPRTVEFLQKPFNQHTFAAKVGDVLAGARARHASSVPRRVSNHDRLLDRLPAAVFVVRGGRFSYVNAAFASLLGISGDELIGRSCVEWVQPADRDLFPTEPGRTADVADGIVASTQVRVRRGDGAERHLLLSTVPVLLDSTPSLLGVATDVSLQPDAVTVAARMAALGRLAGGIAHDYNNLLLVIGGHLERLRDHLPAASALHRDVENIASATARAGTLTDNLLSFGRRQMLTPEIVDLPALIDDLVVHFQPTLAPAIELRVECAAGLPRIEADPLRLREVLSHLIENAREAMPTGGLLTLAADTTTVDRRLKERWAFLAEGAPFVRVRVIDTGRGMDPAVAAHAFEPFFTTKGKGRGAGMGLASVYGIVKQSGGYVFAERTGEQGTCMTILLPQALQRESVASPARATRADVDSPVPPRHRILLVEDDAGVRDLLVDVLQAQGYIVQPAVSAEEAQEYASDRRFDLLLTDLDLPGIDGARLAALVTASHPDTRVIVMSGYPDDGTIDSALGGRPMFLRKPFRSGDLLARVTEVLGPSRRPHERRP